MRTALHRLCSMLFPFGKAHGRPRHALLPEARGHRDSEPLIRMADKPFGVFGLSSISRLDPDFPAQQILNHILVAAISDSRLMDEVRIKRGLTYAISTNLLATRPHRSCSGRCRARVKT